MAGGMVVLGGIVAAPVFLITGYAIAVQGKKALTNAQKYASEVDVAVTTMDSMHAALRLIRTRMDELQGVITELRDRAESAIQDIRRTIDSFTLDSAADSARLASAMTICKAITELLKAPVIVGDDGNVNPDLPNIIARSRTICA
jgi:hypothetical protein